MSGSLYLRSIEFMSGPLKLFPGVAGRESSLEEFCKLGPMENEIETASVLKLHLFVRQRGSTVTYFS